MMKKKFIPLFILLFYMLNINSQEFTHPGLLHSESSLKRVRELVRNEIQPAYGSFNIMRGMPEGKADYCIKGPFETISRAGRYGYTKDPCERDFNAAYYILDNLIASGKAKPMIVVMNCGYAVYAGNKYPEQQPNARSSVNAFVAFEDMMVKDVIPLVDSTYRTLTDKENRAMAGLSWGGKQTLETTLHHRDLFSYIGSFSGALPIDKNTDIDALYEGAFKDPVTFNKDFKFIWLGIGEEEGPNAELLHAALSKKGINSLFYQSPGTAHEWLTWRRCLYQFTPLIFK